MTNTIIWYVVAFTTFAFATPICVRMFRRQSAKGYGLPIPTLEVLLALYWLLGLLVLSVCGLDACPQCADHPMHESLPVLVGPAVAMIFFSSIIWPLPVVLAGVAFAVIVAAVYLSVIHFLNRSGRRT